MSDRSAVKSSKDSRKPDEEKNERYSDPSEYLNSSGERKVLDTVILFRVAKKRRHANGLYAYPKKETG
jgi:hypothetical protein